MQLTNEQKQRLLEIRANLLNDMTALLRQRREAVQILAVREAPISLHSL